MENEMRLHESQETNEKNKFQYTPQETLEDTIKEIKRYFEEKGVGNPDPLYEQDGSEIHRNLEGLEFKFWGIPGNEEGTEHSPIAVEIPGRNNDPILGQLTGIYDNFSQAKEALRKKAQELFSTPLNKENDYNQVA